MTSNFLIRNPPLRFNVKAKRGIVILTELEEEEEEVNHR